MKLRLKRDSLSERLAYLVVSQEMVPSEDGENTSLKETVIDRIYIEYGQKIPSLELLLFRLIAGEFHNLYDNGNAKYNAMHFRLRLSASFGFLFEDDTLKTYTFSPIRETYMKLRYGELINSVYRLKNCFFPKLIDKMFNGFIESNSNKFSSEKKSIELGLNKLNIKDFNIDVIFKEVLTLVFIKEYLSAKVNSENLKLAINELDQACKEKNIEIETPSFL